MWDYLQTLKADMKKGSLLMECIIPECYDWMISQALIKPDRINGFKPAAAMYRDKWLKKNPRRLSELVSSPPVDMEKRSQDERFIRENIAKKMTVDDFVKDMPDNLINHADQKV
jgi:hypothetical protein